MQQPAASNTPGSIFNFRAHLEDTQSRPGFTHVDQETNPQWFVDCLRRQYTGSLLVDNKARTLELLELAPGQRVLDAGCGTGIDALAMASLVGSTGLVIGLDLSAAMLQAVRQNESNLPENVSLVLGDIGRLPFPAGYFDRSRADKTFQHLPHPRQALQELVRVTRPGGKIVIADPDHDSLIIDTPYPDITRRFVQFRRHAMRQGGVAHQLYAWCKQLGLQAVTVEPLTSVYTDYEVKKVTSPYLDEIWMAHEAGVVSAEEAKKWAAYLKKAIDEGEFLCMQTYIITTAMVPQS